MKQIIEDDGFFALASFYLGLFLFVIIFIHPLKSEEEILTNKRITGNFIFIGDIELDSTERTRASDELCTWLAFHPDFDSILVQKTTYLFYIDRQLIREINPPNISSR